MRAQIQDWKDPDYGPIYDERIERLRNIRQLDDDQQRKVHVYYATNPIDWIEDWCFTWDPRQIERGLGALRPFLLMPRQKDLIRFFEACNAGRDDATVEKSRDTGLSWCMVAYAVWAWIYKPGTVIGFGSYEASKVDVLGVTDSLLEKARVIIRNLPPEMLPVGLDTGPHGHLLHKRLLNPMNGAQIVGEIGDNIGRGGRASIYFVDEAAHLKHPDVVDGSLASTSDCKIYASTAYGMGSFYQKVQSNQFEHFQFHWRDDPRKDEEWYQSYLNKWGPVITAREVDIDHTASVENLVIEGQWLQASKDVRRALLKKGVDVPGLESFDHIGVSGLDVGGGKAPSVFIPRFGPYVGVPRAWKDQHGDTTVTGKKALRLARQFRTKNLYFDTVSIGQGVASTLRHSDPSEMVLAPKASQPKHERVPLEEETAEQQIARMVNDAVSAGDEDVVLLSQIVEVKGPDVVKAHGINVGQPASTWVRWPDGRTSQETFVNLRAELWWTMRARLQATFETWLWATDQEGGVLHPVEDLIFLPKKGTEQLCKELAALTYHEKPNGKIGIEAKKDLAARGVLSPDEADALALTFVPTRPRIREQRVEGYF